MLERLLGAWADLAPGQLAAGEPEEPAVRGLAAVLACAALLLDRLPPFALYGTPGALVTAQRFQCLQHVCIGAPEGAPCAAWRPCWPARRCCWTACRHQRCTARLVRLWQRSI